MAWAETYKVWTTDYWAKVIWTDECAFNVGGAPGRVWVARTVEEEFDDSCLLPKFKKLDSIIVWGCFIGRKKGPLIIWDKKEWGKTINAKGYQTHIIPHVDQFWQDQSADTQDYVYIQHDNSSPHRARTTVTDLQDRGLYNYLMPWPATSPDLNLIEAVWRLIKSRISKLLPRPQNNKDMIAAIHTQWEALTEFELGQILDTMVDRVDAVISANGGHTKF